jgi:hypothetical protein
MASPKYQSIDEFGQSLLSRQREKSAAAKRGVDTTRTISAGLSIVNAMLADRAERRAAEVWNSGQEKLNSSLDFFNTGLQFWDDHNKMLGNDFAPENWKEAYKKRYYENYLSSKGLTKADANREDSIKQLEIDLENDLATYEKRMKLAEQFKLSGSETAETKAAAFLQPINDSLTNRMDTINRNAGIIPSLVNLVRGETEDPDEASAQAYFDSVFQQNATWNEATKEWEAAQADNKMMEVLRGKEPDVDVDVKDIYLDSSITRLVGSYAENDKLENDEIVIQLTEGDKTFEGADFGSQFNNEDQAKFWEQAGYLASAAKYKYINAVELQTAGGYEVEGLKTDVQFLQAGVDYLIKEGRVTPSGRFTPFRNFDYNAYSELEISDIVNKDLGFFNNSVFDDVTPDIRETLSTENTVMSNTSLSDQTMIEVFTESDISLQDILADLTNNIVPNEDYAEIRMLTEGLVQQTPVGERRKAIEIADQIYKLMETDPEDIQQEQPVDIQQEQPVDTETNLLSKTNLDRIIEYDTTNKFKDLDRDVLQTMPEKEVQTLLDRALNQERIAERSRKLVGDVSRAIRDSWNKERNRGETIQKLRADDPDAYKQFQRLSNMPGISEEQALDIILSE